MSIKKRGSLGIEKSIKKFKRQKVTLPKILGNIAKNWFLEGFRKGGGQTDAGKWVPRKKKDAGRAILVRSGHLRDSISLSKSIGVTTANFGKIVIASKGVRYARAHNEGLGHQPKREFLGNSKPLENQLERRIKKEIDKVFK